MPIKPERFWEQPTDNRVAPVGCFEPTGVTKSQEVLKD